MTERKIWFALAGIAAVLGAVQFPWPPSRFGGVFFLVLAAGCAGEGLMLLGRDKYRLCRVLAVVGRVLFGLFVLSFVGIQLLIIAPHMQPDEESRAGAAQADYFLVLGALVNPDGQPSSALAARCDAAIALLNEYPAARAILCGGQGGNEPRSEADAMFDYMAARGIDPTRLLCEDQSTNTIQNIRNAREFLAPGDRTAVVTNDYHVARACMLMRSAGLDPVGVPVPTPYPAQWVAVRCREYCSILGLMLSGRWVS